MKAPFDFVIEPKGNRYNNTKKIGDKELILNTEVFIHQYVSREAIVKHIPLVTKTKIQPGDEVIVHHNVFRRWHDIKGVEKNSRSYIDENTYAVGEDQIFAYKRKVLMKEKTCGGEVLVEKYNQWEAADGFCFVKPIKSNDELNIIKERPLIGIMKYTNKDLPNINNNDLVGFTPRSEFEFVIDGERLYRVLTQDISIKYEYQGDEEEYNPSWT